MVANVIEIENGKDSTGFMIKIRIKQPNRQALITSISSVILAYFHKLLYNPQI